MNDLIIDCFVTALNKCDIDSDLGADDENEAAIVGLPVEHKGNEVTVLSSDTKTDKKSADAASNELKEAKSNT